jgi:capsular exopolysaccharide synthesis family protein
MTAGDPPLASTPESTWHRPRVEAPGLQRYLRTLRERAGMIVATVVLATLAAAAYLAVADKVYEAEADLLVTPVSDDPALSGLGLLRESSDPTRDVETAARLVESRDVAERAKRSLRTDESVRSLLDKVEAAPIAQSNVVAVTAEAGSAARARDIANAFAEGVVAERTAELHAQLDRMIPRLRERVASDEGAGATGPGTLAAQLGQLETLRAGSDPTLRVETPATAPPSAASPRPAVTMLAGILGGLILGVGGAFVMHAIDPKLRREEQLRELYTLPILARIPQERRARTATEGSRRFGFGPRRRHGRALGPRELSPTTLQAYRTLRAMLAASHPDRGVSRSILVTGSSPSEGKTTTAINLASSLALTAHRVILLEADFRRPTVGEALGVRPRVGIAKVLFGSASLEEALVPAKPFGENLRALVVDRANDSLAEVLSLPTAGAVLAEAKRLADYVVIDSPPLTEVIDALPLASQVDDVVLVVRLGSTNVAQLSRLGDLLEQNNIRPSGFAVVGVGSSEEQTYYLSSHWAREHAEWLAERAGDESERQRIGSAGV